MSAALKLSEHAVSSASHISSEHRSDSPSPKSPDPNTTLFASVPATHCAIGTQRSDPNSWLVDALATLPPGTQLLDAWKQGPAALFGFLDALWAAEEARRAPDTSIRLDRGNERLRVLADLCNDDVPA